MKKSSFFCAGLLAITFVSFAPLSASAGRHLYDENKVLRKERQLKKAKKMEATLASKETKTSSNSSEESNFESEDTK